MSARLVPLPPARSPIIPLLRPILLLGRHPECDVKLDLPAISRRHCCVAVAGDQAILRDLGSRHGVYLNGARVEEAKLQSGDEIAVGPILFRFEDPEAEVRKKADPAPPVDHPSDPDNDLLPLSSAFPLA